MTIETLRNRMIRRKEELEKSIKNWQDAIIEATASGQVDYVQNAVKDLAKDVSAYKELMRWLDEVEGN